MIISASRRTDIPCFFSDWFLNRIKEGYVLTRNPFNPQQVSRLCLSPDLVDGIVFWSKNPLPMLNKLEQLRDYAYYFQFTVTSYGNDIESNVPSKNDSILPAFRRLADLIGPDRVVWRYDPILLTEKYSHEHHVEYFEKIADKLSGYTKKCVVSFVDNYRHIESRIKPLGMTDLTGDQVDMLAQQLSDSARRHGMTLDTCAERVDLGKYGIKHGRCIDASLIEKIRGCSLLAENNKSRRPACGCDASIDIGIYSTCRNGCIYCYANRSQSTVGRNTEKYDLASPILCDAIGGGDRITARSVKSNMMSQLRMPDPV